jgi:16S rRNA (uracil1498-N3)-methyltransferase
MTDFKTAVKNDKSDIKIIFYEGGGAPLSQIITPNAKSVAVFIGPEGGFEQDEVDFVVANGGTVATLGKRILRTQTAPVASLTAIMLLTGNLE